PLEVLELLVGEEPPVLLLPPPMPDEVLLIVVPVLLVGEPPPAPVVGSQLAVWLLGSTTHVKREGQPDWVQSPEWHWPSLPHVVLMGQSVGCVQTPGPEQSRVVHSGPPWSPLSVKTGHPARTLASRPNPSRANLFIPSPEAIRPSAGARTSLASDLTQTRVARPVPPTSHPANTRFTKMGRAVRETWFTGACDSAVGPSGPALRWRAPRSALVARDATHRRPVKPAPMSSVTVFVTAREV